MLSEKALSRRKWNDVLYDNLMSNSILKVLADHITANTVTIDIGGNTGYQTYFHAQYNNVITYEPVPKLFDVLKENLKDIEKKVTFVNKAVGSTNRDLTLHVDVKRLSMTSQIPLVDDTEPMVVPCVALDNEDLDNVGFIKIDVEGYELDVLKGAVNVIKTFRPTMMVEIYQPWCENVGFDSREIFDFFADRDYSIYYYNNKTSKLVKCTVNKAVKAVHELHHLHDGDFLFKAN